MAIVASAKAVKSACSPAKSTKNLRLRPSPERIVKATSKISPVTPCRMTSQWTFRPFGRIQPVTTRRELSKMPYRERHSIEIATANGRKSTLLTVE
jgi:hypothetical protein